MTRASSSARRVLCGIALAAIAVACGDTTGPPQLEPVASVEITGTPAELYVGADATLVASVRDAAGQALTGRAVSWLSSDSTIASVTAQGVVTGRKVGDAVIVATSEQKSATATLRVRLEPVATVEISGAPASSVLEGTVVQLTATTRNAGGTVLTGRPITWTSSDAAVAQVSAEGRVQTLRAGEVTITAAAEGKSAAVTVRIAVQPPASVQITGGPASGQVVAGATVQLTATARNAAGAPILGRPFTWTVSDAQLATVSATGLVQTLRSGEVVVTATNEGVSASYTLRILEPVATVQIVGAPTGPVVAGTVVRLRAVARSAAGDSLPGRTVFWTSGNYSVATVSPDGVVQTLRAGIVQIGATVEEQTGSFTLTVLEPVATVSVNAPASGLYTTQEMQLSATARSAMGTVLTGRPVTWSTSNAARATVDSTGKVTAVAEGEATITATVEGQTGSVNLRVVPRPVADWSQSAPWTTFQGNARHTGHVPVTADPVAFRELWKRSPLGATALNPVTEGGGRVFVSGYAYFGGQSLAAVDARTGASAWSYSFGPIHGVHPPAYGNGRVYATTSGHGDSYLWAFDAATGAVAFRSGYGNQWSRYLAPVVTPERVFMAGGYYGGMYSFNATDGAQRWFVNTNQYDEWTPAVADGRVYAYTGSYSPQLQVHDAATGATLYTIADPDFRWHGWSMGAAPVLGSLNNVLVAQYGRLVSFDLQARTIGWERTASFTGNVTVADGTLYVFNNNQVEARRESDGSLLWVWIPPAGQTPQGTMVATKNLLFVSTASHTYAIDLNARVTMWSYAGGGHLALTQDGVLLIAQQSGWLSAVDLK